MNDFSLYVYQDLLLLMIGKKHIFSPFNFTTSANLSSNVALRHDVDTLSENSLNTAVLENKLEIRGTYFFRVVPQSNVPAVIKKIASLGHEIGYHYEDLTLCKGNMDEAIRSFEKNLNYFRQFYPVKTICMHGSPLSQYDNRKLWEKYDYRDFGILAEPYFDVDYTKVLYLTDTGRRWDGERVSVRDRVRNSREKGVRSREKEESSREYGVRSKEKDLETGMTGTTEETGKTTDSWKGDKWDNGPLDKNRKMVSRDENGILIHNFHSTFDIIRASEENRLPDQIMITVHPQRWTNNPILWTKELVMQNLKNQVKRILVRSKG